MRKVESIDSKDDEVIKSTFIHRDISWLSFNERVLQEAKDHRNPLLERVKFLGIYSKNLGEFFHVRMAYHLNLIRVNKKTRKRLDYSPKKLIKQITDIVNRQQIEFSKIINEDIIPRLADHNIHIRNIESITDAQREYIDQYFDETLRLFVDPVLMRGKDINPFLKDGSLYLGILLQKKTTNAPNDEYGLVKIPSDMLPRFHVLPSSDGCHDLILIDDILRHNLPILFPGFDVKGAYSFKMTRDAELYIDNNMSSNIKEAIKKNLAKRQVGIPARFVYDRNMPDPLLQLLTDSFDLSKYDKIKEGKYQNFYDFLKFPSFGKAHLLDNSFQPLASKLLCEHNLWDAIDREDHFIHPPYHDFESAIRFFEIAAEDEHVIEISITQYRIGSDSRILNALIEASSKGKKITVFLEVQARFDEKANLEWGEKLEQANVNVVYSIPGVKVHCKIGIVKRKVDGNSKEYAILSTGNFHEGNSRIYSDMCLFTSSKDICIEVSNIFSNLENRTVQMPPFNHLLVGKNNLREILIQLIDQEIENAKNGEHAKVILKLNSLEDPQMIEKLYEASRADVEVDLIVRGICCLVPGVSGQSENIRVVSILDRYLEHARVYYFHNNGENKLYLSSADLMTRNLSRRVEVAFPIYSVSIKNTIYETLKLQLSDNVKARLIDQAQSNGYVTEGTHQIQSQHKIYEYLKANTAAQVELSAMVI